MSNMRESGGEFIRPRPTTVVRENIVWRDPTDGSNKRYRQSPSRPNDPHWGLGWTDGRLGQSMKPKKDEISAAVKIELSGTISRAAARQARNAARLARIN